MVTSQIILCLNGYHERKQMKHIALRTLGLNGKGEASRKNMLPVPTMHSVERIALKKDCRWQHQPDTRNNKTKLQEQSF